MSAQNLEVVLERIRTGLKLVDIKTKTARNIRKQLKTALEICSTEGRVVLGASLSVDLFMIDNSIETLENAKEQLTAKYNQVVGMAKLTKEIKTKAKKATQN